MAHQKKINTSIKLLASSLICLNILACTQLQTRHEPKDPTPIQSIRDRDGTKVPPQNVDKSVDSEYKSVNSPTNVQVQEPVSSQNTVNTNIQPQNPVTTENAVTALMPKETPKVGLIFGPGGMRSFAYVGVLKEFSKARIPISSVIGFEWGSLFAGLYALQGQANEVEFKSMRLRESDLPGKALLGSKIKPESIQTLGDYLNQVFGNNLFEKTKIDYACPSYNYSQDHLSFLARGSIRDGLTRCLPYPPYFKDTKASLASPFAVEEAVQYMKAKGVNLIILVNVLGSGEWFPKEMRSDYSSEEVLFQELHRYWGRTRITGVNLTLNVPTPKISIVDYDSRRKLIDLGSDAAKEITNRLVKTYGY